MVTRRLPLAVMTAALMMTLPGCGGKSLSRGDSGGSNSASGGSGGAAAQAPRISSPLKMDLSRPPEEKIARLPVLRARRSFEEHAKTFMTPSHGQWLAATGWPYYTGCESEYRNDLTVEAKGDTLTVKGTVDISDCVKIRNEPLEQGNVQVYAKLLCPGKDLSELDGAELSALTQMPCDGSTDVQFINQSIVDIKSKVRVAGIAPFDLAIKEQHSFADGNGQGCHYQGKTDELAYARSCVAVSKIAYDSPYRLPVIGLPLNRVQFFKATFENLPFVADAAKPWYESQKASFEIDGWAGDVTYQGVDSSPKFSLKKGGASVEGSL